MNKLDLNAVCIGATLIASIGCFIRGDIFGGTFNLFACVFNLFIVLKWGGIKI